MTSGIQATLGSLKEEQINEIYREILLVRIGQNSKLGKVEKTAKIYEFLQKVVKAKSKLDSVNDLDILNHWKEDMIPIILAMKIEKNLKKNRDLLLSEIVQIGSVIDNLEEIDLKMDAISRQILLLLFKSLSKKEEEAFIKAIETSLPQKLRESLVDNVVNRAVVEAILNGTFPIALGAASPILASVILSYLSTGFLATVILPAILGIFGVKIAAITGALTVAAGPVGWGVAGTAILGSVFFSGSNVLNKRDQALFLRTILSIYTSRFQNNIPTFS
jgi:hypothetical protein